MGFRWPARFKLPAVDWPARGHVLRYVIVAILVSARARQRERERTSDGTGERASVGATREGEKTETSKIYP